MDTDLVKELKRRFGFNTWRGVNTLKKNLFILRFSAAANYQLPGWKPVRIKKVELPDTPVQLQTLWQKEGHSAGVLLRVDIFDCDSREEAQDWLIEVLANAETPLLEKANQRIGDVAFGGGPNPWLAFARANLVIFIRNEGSSPIDVVEPAKELDDELSSEPAETAGAAQKREDKKEEKEVFAQAPQMAVRSKTVRAGQATPLDVDLEGHPESPQWYKIFSDGEISRKKTGLVYKAGTARTQNIKVHSLSANQVTASKSFRLNLKK